MGKSIKNGGGAYYRLIPYVRLKGAFLKLFVVVYLLDPLEYFLFMEGLLVKSVIELVFYRLRWGDDFRFQLSGGLMCAN